MPSKLNRHRHSAYLTQSGNCYYCKSPMWEHDVQSFSERHNITISRAKYLKCTAEHLVARQDGGDDSAQNIVAACSFCNHGRHRIKRPPTPNAYLKRVMHRISTGRWNSQWLRSAGQHCSDVSKAVI